MSKFSRLFVALAMALSFFVLLQTAGAMLDFECKTDAQCSDDEFCGVLPVPIKHCRDQTLGCRRRPTTTTTTTTTPKPRWGMQYRELND